jgi:DNA invertase Pin-like site-specific DNA recombinase
MGAGEPHPCAEIRFFAEKRSGKTMDREELNRLLRAEDTGKIDTVVVL